jgi:glycosyltransferase involved in cell wall biosynthesis
MPKPLVTVVIPAFNASRTVAATLDSVVAQTYDNLEILVVDDGSTDSTEKIVLAYRDRHPRIALLKQANGGVASARNLGIRAAQGEYIAPIDADDIWHPTKIEKQMTVMLAGGTNMGLVFSPHRRIDASGDVLQTSPFYDCQGWVLCQHVYTNFVGNGSSPLFLKRVALEVGGYDSRLRAWGVEGCEDWLFQLKIATRYRFGCMPEYLVGYRQVPEQMSSDGKRMFDSYRLALRLIRAECPAIPLFICNWALAKSRIEMVPTLIRHRDYHGALQSVLYCLRQDFVATLRKLTSHGSKLGKHVGESLERLCAKGNLKAEKRSFYDFDPTEGLQIDCGHSDTVKSRLGQLMNLDRRLTEAAAYRTSAIVSPCAAPSVSGPSPSWKPEMGEE